MSDETKDVIEEVVEAPKASAKKKAVKADAPVEEVIVDEPVVDVEVIQASVDEALVEGKLGFSPGSYSPPVSGTATAYNMWNPWVTAQNGDVLGPNTTINAKDWAGAIVLQTAQYNTTQRGF